MLVHINVKLILNFIWTILGERRCKHYSWDGKVPWQSGARNPIMSHHTTNLTQEINWERKKTQEGGCVCFGQGTTEN